MRCATAGSPGGTYRHTQHCQESRRDTVLHHRLQLALQGQIAVRGLHEARSAIDLLKFCSEGVAGLFVVFLMGRDGGWEGEECAFAEEIGRQVLSGLLRYKDYLCCRLPWQWNERQFLIT